ncbi:MAG: hypothetical protein ABS920_13965 [Sporosarcina sp.]
MKEKTESIDKVLKETVNGLHNTGTNVPKPSESKPVISKIEATGNLLNKTVTDAVGKTTSEVTNVVNDTVNSVVNELPAIPVVIPVVKDVSATVKKTTTSVQSVVENTGEFVNETLKSTIDVSADEVIEAVETVDKVTRLPLEIVKNDEQNSSRNENFSTNLKENSDVGSAPKREPIIALAPEIGTDVLSKQGGSSELEKHNKIGLNDSSMNDEVNVVVDSILEEPSVDRQSVFQEVKVPDQAKGLIDPFVTSKADVLEKKNIDKPNLPLESSKKWDRLPSAIMMGAPPPTESLNMAMGGQSDLSFWGIVEMFTLQSPKCVKWMHTHEYAMVSWAHAPPGKPPQQPSFINV